MDTENSTTNTEQRLREAMDGVTPGPWVARKYGYEKYAIHDGRGTEVGFAHRSRDARLIALCSPDNIGALLDTIASLRSKLEEAEGARGSALVATPPAGGDDWTVDDTLTAREILDYLGIGSDASLEPYADRRRDAVAKIIQKRIATTPPAEPVVEEWREIEQHVQPRPADGYTAVAISKPGFWMVKGPGPAAALATQPAVKDDETVVEAAHKALVAGKMLLENSIGYAVNRYGDDYYIHGEPGWLADCRKDLEALEAALAAKDGRS